MDILQMSRKKEEEEEDEVVCCTLPFRVSLIELSVWRPALATLLHTAPHSGRRLVRQDMLKMEK